MAAHRAGAEDPHHDVGLAVNRAGAEDPHHGVGTVNVEPSALEVLQQTALDLPRGRPHQRERRHD